MAHASRGGHRASVARLLPLLAALVVAAFPAPARAAASGRLAEKGAIAAHLWRANVPENPHRNVPQQLRSVASFYWTGTLWEGVLRDSQFPDVFRDMPGEVHKPESW